MKVTDEMVERAIQETYGGESWMPPYGAQVANFPDLDDLREADRKADELNRAAMRRILEAALGDE